MVKFDEVIKDIVEEWNQNFRVRYGALAIALIIAFWLILNLQDIVSTKKIELSGEAQDFRDIQLIESESFWSKQLEVEKALESQTKKMF